MKHKTLQNYKIIVFIVMFILFMFLLINYLGHQSSTNRNIKQFESEHGSFDVEVPENWDCINVPFYKATNEYEGSPDGGLQIVIDGNSHIFIQASIAPIQSFGTYVEDIVTNDGRIVKAYSFYNDDRIKQVIFNDYIGVIIVADNNIYDEHKESIITLIKSIRIT